jgi:DNA-binding beta-propeller fold protein YncE
MCPNGTRLLQVRFGQSGAIGIDPRTGVVWAPEMNDSEGVNEDQIVRVAQEGTILTRLQGYRTETLAVDPRDGSVWTALPNQGQLVKLNSNGEVLLGVPGFSTTGSITVDPRDGDIWVAEYHPARLVHVSYDGVVLFEIATATFYSNLPHQIAVDPRDGSLWFVGDQAVYKLNALGQSLIRVEGFLEPVAVAVDPADGSVWVASYESAMSGQVARLSAGGEFLVKIPLEERAHLVGVNPFDGTIWVGLDRAMLRLSKAGKILSKQFGYTAPISIAFYQPANGWRTKMTCLIQTMQPDAGSLSSGDYDLAGGFWHVLISEL